MAKHEEIQLGDEVQHCVTGFLGIAVSRHIYQTGCHRIGVQPRVGESGTLPDSHTFDETELDICVSGKAAVEPESMPKKAQKVKEGPGGPSRYVDNGRHEPRTRR